MYDIKAVRLHQTSGQATLSDLGLKVTHRCCAEDGQSIGHQRSDFVTPYVHETVSNKMQAFGVIWKYLLKFLSRSFMHKKMNIDIHLSQALEILKRYERFATKCGRCVFSNQQYLRQLLSINLQHLDRPLFTHLTDIASLQGPVRQSVSAYGVPRAIAGYR
jgi:hypothetical protein